MNSIQYSDLFRLLCPELLVVLTGFGVLFMDAVWLRNRPVEERRFLAVTVTVAGCLAAIGVLGLWPAAGSFFGGMIVVDGLTQFLKQGLLLLTIFTVLISLETKFSSHVGEYFALVLLATVGMMFLFSSEHLLMIFTALELTSLSLYVLTAFCKESARSAEAALKYFLFGGMAAAFTLFGLSLVYGISGELELTRIAANIDGFDPLLGLAMVMVLAGFGFKVAAAPFHLWAPDAYEGAPTPTAALIASGSKVASFFVFGKIMIVGFAGAEGSGGWGNFLAGWVPVVAVVALLSMVLGNLGAIAQTGVKRLLAYSAVAHAGYVLIGVLAHGEQAWTSVFYYLLTYGLTTVGAFGVVTVVQERAGSDSLASFAGLGRRSPVLALSMFIFLLSLAGIPPLAGFFGKFYLFAAALNSKAFDLSLFWLVVVAIGMSAVSLYYYLQVLKQIYVMAPVVGEPPMRAKPVTQAAIGLLAVLVVILGCAPDVLLSRLIPATSAIALRTGL